MNFISENKKNYFQIIFLICTALHIIFFPFILFKQFNMCVYFYYRLIG
jgi:hypothetical protein